MKLTQASIEVIKNMSLLIAYSTGVDSVALLHLVKNLQEELDLKIGIAHVNHGFREESKEEAEFAQNQANLYSVNYHFKKLDKMPEGENKSHWARRERYNFFKEVRVKAAYDYILTAHHLGDQVETFFVKLLANKELKGIRRVSSESKIFRPLLDFTKKDIINYVKLNNLKYFEDQSNFKSDLVRNRIRNKLLPFISDNFEDSSLESIYNSVKKSFNDYEILENIALSFSNNLTQLEFGSKEWFSKLKEILQEIQENDSLRGIEWRVIEDIFKPKIFFNLGRKHSLRVIDFIFKDELAVDLPGNYRLRRKNGGISLTEMKSE